MKFRQRARHLPVFCVLAAGLLAAGCVTHEPPKTGEPSALLKLQYTYSQFKPFATLRVSMSIKEDKAEKFQLAYRQDIGYVIKEWDLPRVPIHALSIRPSRKTAIEMRLAFFWYTQKGAGEVGCSSAIEFQPQKGKIYLINFNGSAVQSGCTANAFLQTPTEGGKFKLKSVGRPYKVKENSAFSLSLPGEE